MTLDARFEELYRIAPCGLVVTTNGIVAEANDTMLAWLGAARDSFVGSRLVDHLDTGSRLFYETRHAPALALRGELREVAMTLVRSDGAPFTVLVNSAVRGGDVHTAVFDASERSQYERDLLSARRLAEASEMRVRVLQASSSAFVSSTSEEQICQALLASASEAFSATATGVFLLDDNGEYLLKAGDNPLADLLPGAPRASDAEFIDDQTITVSVRDTGAPYAALIGALLARRLDSVSIIPLLSGGMQIGLLACFFSREQQFDDHFDDLQAALSRQAAQAIVRVRLQGELEWLALHDQLTGLANRKLLLETVHEAIGRAALRDSPLSVVFLDLDGFKRINDELGHAAGDAVLEQSAARIRAGVRHDDTVGRYGGDEFVAVCEDAGLEAAASVASRIRDAVGKPLDGVPPGYLVTASVGVVVYAPAEGAQPTGDELLNLADGAMYISKSAGKDRVSFAHR